MPQKIVDVFPPVAPEKRLPVFPVRRGLQKPIPIRKERRVKFNLKRFPVRKVLPLLLLVLVPVAIDAYFNIVGIRVKVWPASQVVALQEAIVADTALSQVDVENKTVPGKLLEEEKTMTKQFSSSGTAWQEKKAHGFIRVFNNYNLAQVLVANTRFLSSGDKLFYSKQRVSIPPGTFVDVEVEAAEAGPDYNIGSSAFSIPGLVGSQRYTVVYGKSSGAMQDGWKGKASQVTKDDLDKAKSSVSRALRAELDRVLKEKAGQDLVLLDKAIEEEIVEAASLAGSGEQVDQFSYKVKMKLKAFVFDRRATDDLVKTFIEAKAGEGKKIDDSGLKIDFNIKNLDFNSGNMAMDCSISAVLYSDVSASSIRESLRAKPLKEVISSFRKDDKVARAEITFWPFWKRKMPSDLNKIKVELKK